MALLGDSDDKSGTNHVPDYTSASTTGKWQLGFVDGHVELVTTKLSGHPDDVNAKDDVYTANTKFVNNTARLDSVLKGGIIWGAGP